MSFENRHIFKGKINNKSLEDFRKFDFNVNDLEERKKIVEQLLDSEKDEFGRTFFEAYFDDRYKVDLSKNEELSEKNNVCQTLEAMANYLLGSKEIREQRKEERQQYFFYMDSHEFKMRTNKEQSLTSHIENMKNGADDLKNEDNIIHFLLNKPKNTKKPKNQVITNKDLKEDSYCGQVLRDYNRYLMFIDRELKHPDQFKGQRYKLTKIKSELQNDMIYTKNHLKGTIGEQRHLLEESSEPDWSKFDWTNRAHIKELLFLKVDFDIDNEVSFLAWDLEALVKLMREENEISEKEYRAFKLIRQGFIQNELSEFIGIKKSAISSLTNKLIDKICVWGEIMGYES